jgi:hypothetical protein
MSWNETAPPHPLLFPSTVPPENGKCFAQIFPPFVFVLGRLGEAERAWRGCGGGGRKTLPALSLSKEGPYGLSPASPALH